MNEKILNCIQIRKIGHSFEQELRIKQTLDNGSIKIIEEWRPVLCSVKSIYGKYSHIDWEKVDWTKSNNVLAYELQISYQTVLTYRHKLGKHGLIKSRFLKYSNIDWENLDWLNKSDQMLSRELGIQSGTIRNNRIKLKKPRSLKYWHNDNQSNKKISDEEIKNIDWVNNSDIFLAKKFGVTRERIRQIRLKLDAPQCKWYKIHTDQLDNIKYLETNRDNLQNKDLKEIISLLPNKNYLKNTITKHLDKYGIKYTLPRHPSKKYDLNIYNFNLPNIILSKIWGEQHYTFAILRNRNLLQKSLWSTAGFRDDVKKKSFIRAIKAEIVKAKKHEKIIDETGIFNYIQECKERRKMIYSSRGDKKL